jgi:hypothetical protein
MTLLGEAFDNPPSKEKIEIYWRTLKDLSIEDFERACINVLNTKKITTFPLIAEIRETLSGNDGLQAWLFAREAVSRHGVYRSVQFPDPVIHSVVEAMGGWDKFCHIPDKERPWKQKEFEKLYEIMKSKNKHPEKCYGLYEIKNTAKGFGGINTTVRLGVDENGSLIEMRDEQNQIEDKERFKRLN